MRAVGTMSPRLQGVSAPAPVEGAARDVSENQKTRIDALYHRLGDIDYFALLGLSAAAKATEVKRAYYELSKEFHPDRWRNKELGPYGERLLAIFKMLSRGYEVLRDGDSRAAYVSALAARQRGLIAPPLQNGCVSSSLADLAWEQATAQALRGSRAASPLAVPVLPVLPPNGLGVYSLRPTRGRVSSRG